MVAELTTCYNTKTKMWTNYIKNWGLMRIIRLVIGGYALYEAIVAHDSMMGLLGFVLVGMALLNAGCGAQGCGVPAKPQINKDSTEELEFEEVRSK